MNYLIDPDKGSLKDSWVFIDGEDIHLFFLADPADMNHERRWFGHAVSRDWLHWTNLPDIDLKGAPGEWDHGRIGTGHTFRHEDGAYYMAYTGRTRDPGTGVEVEHVGLLVSRDLVSWTKPFREPVWRRSQGPGYERDDERAARMASWRDPAVFRRPDGTWEALCCARTDAGPLAGRACVARARVDDLRRWETLPPIACPGAYGAMEVPEIFELNGRFWLVFSTSASWSPGLDVAGRRRVLGTLYLVADRWEGPYSAPQDNLLIGAGDGRADGYVARAVEHDGRMLAYYHFHGNPRAWAIPKVLASEGDRLYLKPWDGQDRLRTRQLTPCDWRQSVTGNVPAGRWLTEGERVDGACALGGAAWHADVGARDVDIQVLVNIGRGKRAGVLFALADDGSHGLCVLLDAARGEATIGHYRCGHVAPTPDLEAVIDRVARPVHARQDYRLRILKRGKFAELFVGGELVFSTTTGHEGTGGRLGFVVDSGEGRFQLLRAHEIEPLAPSVD